MSTTLTDRNNVRWYRQGWPWFLIALPAIAVIAGLITLVIAIRTWDGLVVDDYYKEGRAIVQTIGRTERARELGLSARVKIRSDALRIELAARDAASLPDKLIVTVSHPTRAGLDQVLTLSGANGVFEGGMTALGAGRWLFQLEDESRSWRMNGTAYLPTETEIRMDPSVS
ncbi:FixH family protein [Thauera sinica]|uniref:FixH family protein n=1 Tax=Thauera sinica TaxID=2665146 RepID=A0ABW1ALU4_9RHOO|nr:FixH family protein [Thauera sp. K11]ATE60718.1 nitrogen fixation protein FixH [Thauera sp. K11]